MVGVLWRLLRPAPLVALALLLLAVVADAASSIQVNSGRLVAKGAEVYVTVTYSCPDGWAVIQGKGGGGIFVNIQQAVNKTSQASGSASGGTNLICDGTAHSAVVQVLANTPGPPFRVGPAVSTAEFSACSDELCSSFESGHSGPTVVRRSEYSASPARAARLWPA